MLTSKSRKLAELAVKERGKHTVVHQNVGTIALNFKTFEEEMTDAYRNNIQKWIQERTKLQKMPDEQRRKGLSRLARNNFGESPNWGTDSTERLRIPDGPYYTNGTS